MPPRNPRSHFVLPESFVVASPYRAVNTFASQTVVPVRNRAVHAAALGRGLAELRVEMPVALATQRAAGWEEGLGLRVVFASFPNVHMAVESLDLKSEGIELLNVREVDGVTIATVWLPEGKLEFFEEKIVAYLAAEPNRRDNRKLLDAISSIRAAVIEDLWTGDAPIPADDNVTSFEAWISTPIIEARVMGRRRSRSALRLSAEERVARFRAAAEFMGMVVGGRALFFPERAVLQVRGTIGLFKQSASLLGQLAELRQAPEVAEFFMGLEPEEQVDWTNELLRRSRHGHLRGVTITQLHRPRRVGIAVTHKHHVLAVHALDGRLRNHDARIAGGHRDLRLDRGAWTPEAILVGQCGTGDQALARR